MDIHNIKYRKVRDNNIKLVFFNKSQEREFNPKLVSLVDTSPILKKDNFIENWHLKDELGNEYTVRNTYINETGEVDLDNISNLFYKSNFKTFCKNNELPEDSILDITFFKKHIKKLDLYKKRTNYSINIWDIRNLLSYPYSSIIIIDKQIVGRVVCEVFNERELEDESVLSKRMNLYISYVDVHPRFQGLGLCKPLLSYMISNLRILGYEQLFIYNASRTNKGIPACLCYYRAGVQNNYKMRTHKKTGVSVMTEKDCDKTKRSDTYFYMSNNISKRVVSKIKKKFKIKN